MAGEKVIKCMQRWDHKFCTGLYTKGSQIYKQDGNTIEEVAGRFYSCVVNLNKDNFEHKFHLADEIS